MDDLKEAAGRTVLLTLAEKVGVPLAFILIGYGVGYWHARSKHKRKALPAA